MDKVGWYVIIRYVHEVERDEHINVGVALLSPGEEIKILVSVNPNRAKRLFENEERWDEEWFEHVVESFKERMENDSITSLEQLKIFMETRANQMQFGGLRGIKIKDGDVNAAVKTLFERLV